MSGVRIVRLPASRVQVICDELRPGHARPRIQPGPIINPGAIGHDSGAARRTAGGERRAESSPSPDPHHLHHQKILGGRGG
jgi:hypothetical protein